MSLCTIYLVTAKPWSGPTCATASRKRTRRSCKQIERRFYRWFCDLWLETLKTLTISGEEVSRRVVLENDAVLRKYFEQKRSVILVLGHLGNWELGGARFATNGSPSPHGDLPSIIEPLFRTAHRAHAHPAGQSIVRDERHPAGHAARSQHPHGHGLHCRPVTTPEAPSGPFPEPGHAVFSGTEKIARRSWTTRSLRAHQARAARALRMSIRRTGGRPAETANGEITAMRTRNGWKSDIRRQPELWLWTHRRWKHKRAESTGTGTSSA